jgi:hypothetical protein
MACVRANGWQCPGTDLESNLKTGGLSLEQAPPLSIPASFFLSIPLAVLFAAYILLTHGMAAFISPWMPQALALTHAGTIGVLAMGMIGALYQMTPVIAGTAVPFTRIAHLVHVLMLAGLAGFAWRLLGGPESAMSVAILCFAVALLAFLFPLSSALLRATANNETVQGIRLAVLSLVIITLMGLLMARGYAGEVFPANRMLWVQIHLTVALLGWVGGLIMAVSWQVIPMFYLAPTVGKPTMKWFSVLLLAGLVLPFGALFVAPQASGLLSAGPLAAIAALPAALVVWLLHPVLILRNISRRKRKRSDASLLFWKTGLMSALMLIPVASAALLLPDPRWQVLFGWLAIWAWAGTIMHGMLGRIVPFLVWFHRYSARVGFEPVPSMRSLLSQERIKLGFYLHTGSVISGVIAILSQMNFMAQLTGILLATTAINLAVTLIHTLRPGDHVLRAE